MGGAYGSPNFKDLLEAVSYMIMHCYTGTYTPESTTHPPKPTEEGYQIIYQLEENVINECILHPEFLKIAVKNVSDYLGFAFAHLSFNNYNVSKAVAEQLFKQINDSDTNKIEACMGFARPFLSIDDDLKYQRAEWILGFSSLLTQGAMPNKINKFGLFHASQITHDIHTYLTPLTDKKSYGPSTNSLLQMLWRYINKMDSYVCYALASFL